MAPMEESSGVYKKIIAQSKAFVRQGYNLKILFVRDTSDAWLWEDDHVNFVSLKDSKILESIKMYLLSCEFCYVRFELLRHKFYRKIIRLCKKLHVDIITEIPTYPPYQESLARAKEAYKDRRYLSALKTLVGTLFVVLDVYITTLLSNIIVIVADDKQFFFAKTVRIENGVDMDMSPCVGKKIGNPINIIAVSNFSVWNGYDRAIVGLKQYIDSTGNSDIMLTFVGDTNSGMPLIKQAQELGLSKYINFTGALSGKALDDEYSKADAALCALGNHRRKVFANSSLKAKEYTSRGILMVMSDAEGIEEEIKEKSLVVKSDESPLDFTIIKEWLYSFENISVAQTYIREFAKTHYSWDLQVYKVLEYFNKR